MFPQCKSTEPKIIKRLGLGLRMGLGLPTILCNSTQGSALLNPLHPTDLCRHFENCVRQFLKTSWWKIVEN